MKYMLHLILLILLILNIYSCRKKNELPTYSTFPEITLRDPIQTPTQRPPFTATVENQQHTIKPLFDYQISGMVVSCGFSKYQAEYRNDKLNLMDAGIIWGANLDPSIYKSIRFRTNGVWLQAQTKNKAVWERLDQEQLSNNHLLCTNTHLVKQIKTLKRGDIVSIKGCLVSYSGRKSSVIRSDTGSSACEAIWVDDFDILQDGTKHWHILHNTTLYGMAVWFIVKVMLFFRITNPGPRQ
jgi:hypothetical protein